MSVISTHMQKVALSVGQSCIRWSDIEFTLHELCLSLARFHDRELEQKEAAHVLSIALSVMDLRQRIATAKALAADGIDPDLYGELERLLNLIDNDLRIERNRFVHDTWQERDGVTVRTSYGAKVTRPQSRKLEVRFKTEVEYASLVAVEAFSIRMEDAFERLAELVRELSALYYDVWPPADSGPQT